MSGKVRLAVALGALVALAAVTAYGDYNVLDKSSYYQNATSGAKTDATGNAYYQDASRDRDKVIKYDNIINDTCAVGMADSTVTLLDTHDVGRGYLYISATLAAGHATPFIRLAVRVQGCTNATDDSLNTHNIYPKMVTGIDTSGVVSTLPVPNSVTTSGSEFIVTINSDNAVATKWGRPHTVIVPISDASPGGWFWSEYTKVVVRNLSSGMTGGVPTVRVSYRGTPL